MTILGQACSLAAAAAYGLRSRNRSGQRLVTKRPARPRDGCPTIKSREYLRGLTGLLQCEETHHA